jgi:hypothetical protein
MHAAGIGCSKNPSSIVRIPPQIDHENLSIEDERLPFRFDEKGDSQRFASMIKYGQGNSRRRRPGLTIDIINRGKDGALTKTRTE